VGSFFKQPVHPIWVVASESHYSILFALTTRVQAVGARAALEERLLAAFARLRAEANADALSENGETSTPAYLVDSVILSGDASEDLVRHYDLIFWAGSGYGFLALCIGDFLTACQSCEWFCFPEVPPSVSHSAP
jgi:hypothetical protein